MGDLVDRALAHAAGQTGTPAPPRPPRSTTPKHVHPRGFEPGYYVGRDGNMEMVAQTDAEQAPEIRDLLTAEGFDPDRWHIVDGAVEMRKWNQHYLHPDKWCYYWKWKMEPARGRFHHDIDALVERVGSRRRRKPPAPSGTSTWVVCTGDWQAGAGHGGGPEELIARIDKLADSIVDGWRTVRRIEAPDRIVVVFTGDLVENCQQGTNPRQLFSVKLNDRDQRKVARYGVDTIVETAAALAPTHVITVPGNHGENRNGGKSNTDNRDNIDVAVVEDVQFAYSKHDRGRYDHVSFQYPIRDDLALTWADPNSGLVVCFAHGHQWNGGGKNPMAKAEEWWRGNMAGKQSPGEADVLVTAHYHHYRESLQAHRRIIQVPALCGRQDWFTNMTGMDSPPGSVSFLLTPHGVDHVRVIDGRVAADHEALAAL